MTDINDKTASNDQAENDNAAIESVRDHDVSRTVAESKDVADVNNISEAEGQVKKLPYPKAVFFIISNEFCERFNYYGLRTILVLYLTRNLAFSTDDATVIYHVFTMLVYFLCTFGAIISDSWLGKFKTILYLSMVYVCGSIMVALGAIPTLNVPPVTFTMIGLALIAIGSGGIKPCVAAFGGDQFKMPEQVKQVTTFFSLFYFSINMGSFVSSTVTPILREDVHCFGEKECYSVAFGVPALLMALSIVIFVLGRPLYKIKPPAGNMVVLVSKTIGNAIKTKWNSKEKREHWLDYADQKYDKNLIDDIKVLMRVLVLFLPLPIFWTLFDQQGSRWVFQATRMNGDMGSWNIKPDQVQMLNPLMILIFIPLYDIALYPLLDKIGIRRPLQKLTMGGFLAGVAFILSAIVELQLEKTYPTLPSRFNAQLRIFNGETCDYNIATNIPGQTNFIVKALDNYVYRDIQVPMGEFDFQYNMTTNDPSCRAYGPGNYMMKDNNAYSFFMNSKNSDSPLDIYTDFIEKPSRGYPMARALANVKPGSKIVWTAANKGKADLEELSQEHNLTELSIGAYKVSIDGQELPEFSLYVGGVYTLLINEASNGGYNSKLIEVIEPNSVNILWVIPQYAVITLGEVMFSVTGLEFSYAQAPLSMKSVLQACWLLTIAVGNVIVIIIAELKLFDLQSNEFFLFAGIMIVDSMIFSWVAYRYKPNTPRTESESEPLTTNNDDIAEKKQIPQGFDNMGKEIDE